MKKLSVFSLAAFALLVACNLKKATVDNDLKKYFDEAGVEGCFTMMDNKTGGITVYNITLDTLRFVPSATFNPFLALVGLETGKILNEDMVVPYNGEKYADTSWNKSFTLKQAFQQNAYPYFKAIANKLGADTIKNWIDTLGYGNKTIGNNIDSFWVNSTLKISPDEQVGFLKRLYFDQLPFRKSTQETVRGLMLKEANTVYKLSYVASQGQDDKYKNVGRLSGFIEENNHVYFFSTIIVNTSTSEGLQGKTIDLSKKILKHYQFFEGKK
jgi:beta-lactamase class D